MEVFAMKKKRIATIDRETKETKISLELSIDGEGKAEISTGIPFLDHMLILLAKHGLFDLTISAKGDLEVDIHHTNEDIGLVLGEAFRKALKVKKGIRRFGFSYVPMDEALGRAVLDFSGRAYFSLDSQIELPAPLEKDKYDYETAKHFCKSFADRAGLTLHLDVLKGNEFHHIVEALFKALGKALDEATQIDPRIKGIPSTKGTL